MKILTFLILIANFYYSFSQEILWKYSEENNNKDYKLSEFKRVNIGNDGSYYITGIDRYSLKGQRDSINTAITKISSNGNYIKKFEIPDWWAVRKIEGMTINLRLNYTPFDLIDSDTAIFFMGQVEGGGGFFTALLNKSNGKIIEANTTLDVSDSNFLPINYPFHFIKNHNGYIICNTEAINDTGFYSINIIDKKAKISKKIFSRKLPNYNFYPNSIFQNSSDNIFVLSSRVYQNSKVFYSYSTGLFFDKINADGKLIWSKIYAEDTVTYSEQMCETKDAGVLVIMSLVSSNILKDTIIHDPNMYLSLYKIDSNGNMQWNKKFTVDNNINNYIGFVKEIKGGYLLGVNTIKNRFINSELDSYLVKIDGDGNVLWHYKIASDGRDEITDCLVLQNGNFIVGGVQSGKIFIMEVKDGISNINDIIGLPKFMQLH